MKPTEIRLFKAPWGRGVEILIREKLIGDPDHYAVAKPIVMETLATDAAALPSLTLSNDAAQTLMDDLWGAGFRPTEGSGSAGSLRATEKHLDDMRKIAGKYLEVAL